MAKIIEMNQISNFIVLEVKKALAEVAQEITQELYDNLTGIYMYPRSVFYTRTEQFLNALIKPKVYVIDNEVTVTVGMDSTLIHSNPRPTDNNKQFGEHSSFDRSDKWHGKSIGEALLGWWDEGTSNNVAPSLPQTNYWYDVFGDRGYKDSPNYTKLNKLLNDKLTEKLSKFGAFERIHDGGD